MHVFVLCVAMWKSLETFEEVLNKSEDVFCEDKIRMFDSLSLLLCVSLLVWRASPSIKFYVCLFPTFESCDSVKRIRYLLLNECFWLLTGW